MKFSSLAKTITTALVGGAVGSFLVYTSLSDAPLTGSSTEVKTGNRVDNITLVKRKKPRTRSTRIKVPAAQRFLRLVQRHPTCQQAQPQLDPDHPYSNAVAPYDGGFYFSPVALAVIALTHSRQQGNQ